MTKLRATLTIKLRAGLLICLALALAACVPATATLTPTASSPLAPSLPAPTATPLAIPIDSFQIVHTYPHDRGAFTEGLVYANGSLFESTGLLGRSSLRRVDLQTGAVLQSLALAPDLFGEGLTVFQDRLIQLTWQAHTGFVYGLDNFDLQRQFSYTGEGWGLTHDGQRLILSDGTATLRFLDPQTFAETGRLPVRADGVDVTQLNELEFVDGEIYANLWKTNRIARIDPRTGNVLAWIDLTSLVSAQAQPDPEAVLNGIAYDSATHRLFVTGKLWPQLFEITLTAPAPR